MISSTPDFVNQVQSAEQKLGNEWLSVQELWNDPVAESFDRKVMSAYMPKFRQYITGESFQGLGIEQLLLQMEKHLQDMDSLLE